MAVSKLDAIVPLIAKVVDGEDLTTKEAEKVFTHIFLYDKEGFHFATFMAAIHAKKETADELFGFVNTHLKLGVELKPKISPEKTTDLSGSGGGLIKTFNVSTTASFIVAASGYTVLKNAFWAITGTTGSADIFDAFGVSVVKLSKRKIEKSLERVGICPIYYPLISPRLTNRGEISRKIYLEKNIHVKTPFHLASNVTTPVPMKYRIYGLYSRRYLEIIAKLFSKLKYKKTLTFYGEGGLPEVSNIGKTIVVEQDESRFKEYTINPSNLGVKKAKVSEIKTGGKEKNIIDFLRVLLGKEKGPKADLVAINAAASLYVMGESKSIAESVPKAKEIIKSGEGFRVLEKLVKYQGDTKLLKYWLSRV